MKARLSRLATLFLSAAIILPLLTACHSDEFTAVEYVVDSDQEPITESGLYTLNSSGEEREYYVSLPPGYSFTRD